MHRLWSCEKSQKIGFDVAKVLSDIFNFPVPLYPLCLTLGVIWVSKAGVRGCSNCYFFRLGRISRFSGAGQQSKQRNSGITLL